MRKLAHLPRAFARCVFVFLSSLRVPSCSGRENLPRYFEGQVEPCAADPHSAPEHPGNCAPCTQVAFYHRLTDGFACVFHRRC